jgi:hypothetical protein
MIFLLCGFLLGLYLAADVLRGLRRRHNSRYKAELSINKSHSTKPQRIGIVY